MPKYDNAKLIHKETGEEIKPGSEVPDFRGDLVKFEFISFLPEGNSEGKIYTGSREFYPGVVNARIQPPIGEDMVGCWLDGHWGWHNSYRVVLRAKEYGFKVPEEYQSVIDKYCAYDEVSGFEETLSEDEWESIHGQGELCDKATEWLQELAPEGHLFVWDAGELILMDEESAEMI